MIIYYIWNAFFSSIDFLSKAIVQIMGTIRAQLGLPAVIGKILYLWLILHLIVFIFYVFSFYAFIFVCL